MRLCKGCGHVVCRCAAIAAAREEEPIEKEPLFAKMTSLPDRPAFRVSIREYPAARSHAHGHKRRRKGLQRFHRERMHRGDGKQ